MVRQACKTLLVLLVLCALPTQSSQAQSDASDREHARSSLEQIAHTVYALAWPTATYRDVTFDGIEPADEGFNFLITLDGESMFGGDLWVQLGIKIRHGAIADVSVVRHNALLAPPFQTTRAIGSAIAQEYKHQQSSPAASPPMSPPRQPASMAAQVPDPVTPSRAGAVCLVNATGDAVLLQFRWGESGWQELTIGDGMEEALWWPYTSEQSISPQLVVRYDDDRVPGYTERVYNLNRAQTQLPVSCESAARYTFRASGTKILLYATK